MPAGVTAGLLMLTMMVIFLGKQQLWVQGCRYREVPIQQAAPLDRCV